MAQILNLSAGAIEYTLPLTITETTGKDISGDQIRLTLGDAAQPGTDWRTPDTDTSPTPASRVVQVLIGGTYLPSIGTHYLWWRITDDPEIIPRRAGTITIT